MLICTKWTHVQYALNSYNTTYYIVGNFRNKVKDMTIRCVVLKNHKNRGADYRLKFSKSPHFVKLRCTKLQVINGIHHQYAIDNVKFMLSEMGENPDDFDFTCFDYFEGLFIDPLFTSPSAVKVWDAADTNDIRYLGAVSNDPALNEDETEYTPKNKP